MTDSPPPKKRYGSFALAATAYVAGVILFSAWTFHANRAMLMERNDALLKNAAFATRELLEPAYHADPTTLTDASEEQRDRLSRYARNCGFAVVGATARRQDQTHSLLLGPDPSHAAPMETEGVGELALDLAAATGDGIAVLTINHETLGALRVAALFLSDGPNDGVAYIVALRNARVEAALKELLIRSAAAGAFLLLMIIPLLALYARAQKGVARQLEELNDRLRHEVERQTIHQEELKDAIRDLERFSNVTAGRESRVIELKLEVNQLLEEFNRTKRYNIDKTD